MMREEHTAERNKLIKKMKRIYSIINLGFFWGAYNEVLKYIEQEEQLIKRFQGDLPGGIKVRHTLWLWYRAVISSYRGNLARSFKDANELLMVGQLYDHKRGISDGTSLLGRYYWLSGDLDKALEHFDRAIRLREETLNYLLDFNMLANQLMTATWVSIDKEDIERAKKYFKRLEEIRELKSAVFLINDLYRMAKGYILKSSIRFRDRVRAEDLFREIIEEGRSHFMHKLRALYELCELLLVELKLSNNINLINEIKALLEKLIDMAQQSGIYYFLIEGYVLHGKLALIMVDI